MVFKEFTSGLFTTTDADSFLMSQMIIRCTSVTRPAFPEEGWHIYETDTQKLKVFRNGQWLPDFGVDQDLVVYKTSDETSASTSDHVDAQLTVPVAAATTYLVDLFIAASASVAGTYLDLDLLAPTDATMFFVTNHAVSAEEGPINKAIRESGAIAMSGYVSTNGTSVQIRGTLKVMATGGNFSLAWRTNNATSTITVRSGSCLRLRRVL